jgi:hypothetical protein
MEGESVKRTPSLTLLVVLSALIAPPAARAAEGFTFRYAFGDDCS